jgi:predicted DCC family thiol-disulfide oxidoreductase YuxK
MLVYDGECGFCSRAVRFVVRRDPGGTLQFASRDGAEGGAVRVRHPEFRDVEALLWVDRASGTERVFARSDATLRAMVYLGGVWGILGRAGFLVPRFLRDAVYGVIARVRRRIFGPADPSCLLVPPSERARFLS